jgi:hypothetical protein
MQTAVMSWSIDVEPGGLVRLDPGRERPQLKQALDDCVESLSPAGTAPNLSTYWIDRALAGLSRRVPAESVIASGNAWSLVRRGEIVIVTFEYAEESDGERQAISRDPTRSS